MYTHFVYFSRTYANNSHYLMRVGGYVSEDEALADIAWFFANYGADNHEARLYDHEVNIWNEWALDA